jgi:hypothetical protein
MANMLSPLDQPAKSLYSPSSAPLPRARPSSHFSHCRGRSRTQALLPQWQSDCASSCHSRTHRRQSVNGRIESKENRPDLGPFSTYGFCGIVHFISPNHSPARLRHGAYDDNSAREGNAPVCPMNTHRPRAARTDGWALQYLTQWRQRVESVEKQVSGKSRSARDNRVPLSTGLTDCPACGGHFYGDGPRDRLERLMRRDGRHAHRLRVAVAELDERYRDATVEISRTPTMPWWERRVPWL